MRPEFEHTGRRCGSSLNWVLLVGLLCCLSFWGAVVFGIVAAV